MMVAFYVGCGMSLIGAAFAPSLSGLGDRAVRARHIRGDLSSGRHRDDHRERHPARPHARVQRRVRQSRRLACRRHHRAADRGACPGAAPSWCLACVRRDRRGLFLARSRRDRARGRAQHFARRFAFPRRSRRRSSGCSWWSRSAPGWFSTPLSVALPKIVDERVGNDISLVAVGGLTTAVFMCGAIAQITVGRLVERFPLHMLFAIIAVMQFAGVVWAAYASGSRCCSRSLSPWRRSTARSRSTIWSSPATPPMPGAAASMPCAIS